MLEVTRLSGKRLRGCPERQPLWIGESCGVVGRIDYLTTPFGARDGVHRALACNL